MAIEPTLTYFTAVALTIAIEVAVLLLLMAWSRYPGNGSRKSLIKNATRTTLVLFVIGVNLVTHPIAWLAWNWWAANYWLVETVVVVVEAIALWMGPRLSFWHALAVSFSMNAFSAAVGWLI